jgi:maleate cis-trans isomerase
MQCLEDDLGKPVVVGQVAALWQALRVAGVDARVSGYGRLLSGA